MHLIYTNENNPATLKLLIAGNLSKTEVDIKIINVNDKNIKAPKHLPYLEVNGETVIFTPNAAAQYLYPCSNENLASDVNEWLDYEAFKLSPYIAHVIGNSSRSETLKKALCACLKALDNAVTGKKFLIAEQIGICDIAIWSTLYPLCVDSNLCKEYLSDLPNLLSYLKYFESIDEFCNAIKKFKVTSSLAYNALFNGAKYVIIPDNSPEFGCQSSPQHNVEAVTADEILAAKQAWLSNKRSFANKKECNPVLPVAGEKNILITSALPYVNNVPHLGNIIGCVLSADVFARFCRLRNYNTLFVCGTDEYGTATETKAMEEGLTPQQICDKYFEIHNSIYRWFNIGFDYFGRTTTPEQTKIVQNMFETVNQNGFMFTESVDQLLCENCNRYLADRFVEGVCPHVGCNYEDARGDQCDGCGKLVNANELKNPRCKICSKSPVIKCSKQFFLDLPKIEPLLLHWINKSSTGWTNNAKMITNSWMKEGLKPRCITRDLKWGVPVPLEDFKDKVFYVWFDAPIGYMSITQRYTEEWQKWWQPEANTNITLYQFMAKDNVPFHSVMFPATLLGANKGYTIVSHIMATEYLNYEDGKFSKSRGVGVFGNDAQETGIPSDVWRFYLLFIRPENQDSSFSWVDLATKNNSELLNNLGNFINRALVFAEKYFSGVVPDMKLIDEDYTFLALCTRELKLYIESLEKAKLKDGIRYILSISRHGNQYMQSTQPWVLLKGNEQEKERAGAIIGVCVNIVGLLSVLLSPYLPETCRTIKTQLNAPNDIYALCPDNSSVLNLLPAGHKLGKPSPLFNKIETAQVEELKKKYAGKQVTQNNVQKTQTIPLDVKTLELEISKQALKVRNLKSSGVEKSVWQPEVNILLDLKKQLEIAIKTVTNNQNTPNVDAIKDLEAKIEKQGTLVREIKGSGVPKTEWQPQVNILLDLKKQLTELTGKPVTNSTKGKKSKA